MYHSLDKVTSHFLHFFPAALTVSARPAHATLSSSHVMQAQRGASSRLLPWRCHRAPGAAPAAVLPSPSRRLPLSVQWAVRWYPPAALQERLDSSPADAEAWGRSDVWSLVLVPMLAYLVWAVYYYVTVFVISSKKIQERGYETLFLYVTRSRRSLFARAVLRFPRPLQPAAYMVRGTCRAAPRRSQGVGVQPRPSGRTPLAALLALSPPTGATPLQAVHQLLTFLTLLLAMIWWRSKLASAAFLLAIFTASAWSGARCSHADRPGRRRPRTQCRCRRPAPGALPGPNVRHPMRRMVQEPVSTSMCLRGATSQVWGLSRTGSPVAAPRRTPRWRARPALSATDHGDLQRRAHTAGRTLPAL